MAVRPNLVSAILLCFLLSRRVISEPTQDKQALLAFLKQTPHANRLKWNASDSACNWVGVGCDPTKSFVETLRLPGVGLVGPIPVATIGSLTQLRVLSLRSNRISAPLPSDLSNLSLLRSLYLQENALSGEFPPFIPSLSHLSRLDISSNTLSGPIPFEINYLTRLTGLFLQNNNFSGSLPSITAELVDFNVSNNKLNGSIPNSLSGFPASAFAGNIDLCGGPLPSCNPLVVPPPPAPASEPPHERKKSKKLSTGAIVGIVVGCALFLILLLVLLFLCLRRQKRRQPVRPPKATMEAAARAVAVEGGTSSSKDDFTGSTEATERNKLVFVESGRSGYTFDLEDLLRASAEVLGKGSVGTSYKAVLEVGTVVVVKRLKDVVVTKKEFEAQIDALGKIKHDNVVPLRAYYFSKDEKLLVYDYVSAGSFSALLHGSRGSGRTPLDWDNRLRIAMGAARGLAHLHVSGKLVHGNIKSSNILLQPDQNPSISDFGLNPLFGTLNPTTKVAGYRAPEVVDTRKVTFKSDVYSFGVVLLELLTGKSPNNQASLGDEGLDLPRWVQSVVREEWTAEVFDAELMRYHNIEDDMVQLLQIAMSCVSTMPDQRPKMTEVVRMMEEMNRVETEDGLRKSSDEPSKGSDP